MPMAGGARKSGASTRGIPGLDAVKAYVADDKL